MKVSGPRASPLSRLHDEPIDPQTRLMTAAGTRRAILKDAAAIRPAGGRALRVTTLSGDAILSLLPLQILRVVAPEG
jgi:hypothetical protein